MEQDPISCKHLLPPALWQEIIHLAGPQLQTSLVSTGMTVQHRTSSSTFLLDTAARAPCVKRYERKVTELLKHLTTLNAGNGLRLTKAEAVQIARYQVGQHYSRHYDNKSEQCWRRAATLIVYLSSVEQGGATYFPDSTGVMAAAASHVRAAADQSLPGLRIMPQQGCAIMFWSQKRDGTEDAASLHAAEPVVAGEKWICSRWFSTEPHSAMPFSGLHPAGPCAPEE